MRIVIVGGGWSGVAAAIAAQKIGAEVTILERTDMLLGTGLVGGIMRNNGRFTATEEMLAMGAGDLFTLTDQHARHRNITFPGHKHASLYDIAAVHGAVLQYIHERGIKVVFQSRVQSVELQEKTISSVSDGTNTYTGDVFIDATGTAGGMNNCAKYGNGCAMCVLRCPSFGNRVSLAGLCHVEETIGKRKDGGFGAMSGSCKLYKESLSQDVQNELNEKGVAVIPIPADIQHDRLGIKSCQQYALPAFKENIVLLDTGHAKMMTSYYEIEVLRKIPAFANARFEDPYAGGKGNSIRYMAMSPHNNKMQVTGIANLLCCGEKAGLLVGHTEAIVTGALAGYNSVKVSQGQDLLELPETTAVGFAIAYVNREMQTEEGLCEKYTFSGSKLFEKMQELDLYTTDLAKIKANIQQHNLEDIFVR